MGFGSQSLVKDFLSGVFMLFEDQYGVGDVVDLGSATGTIEAVSLRVTRLRDVDGTVWYVRNGEILRVGNMSQNWARTVLDIPVDYSEDLLHVREVLKDVAHDLWIDEEYKDVIIEEPEVWGVQSLDADLVVVRVTLKTAPMEQWNVAREMRERVKARSTSRRSRSRATSGSSTSTSRPPAPPRPARRRPPTVEGARSGHNPRVTSTPRLVLAGALLAVVALSGCSASPVPACPGQHCSAALRHAGDRVADLPGVTAVRSVELRDGGRSGLVVFRAAPRDAAAARQLNRSVLAVLRKGSGGIADAGDVDLSRSGIPRRWCRAPTRWARRRLPAAPRTGATTALRPGAGPSRARSHETCVPLSQPTGSGSRRCGSTREAPAADPTGRSGSPPSPDGPIDRIRRVADQVAAIAADADVPAAYGERVLVTRPVEHTMLTRWTRTTGSRTCRTSRLSTTE